MNTPADQALRAALAAHLDPEGGSPYWLERRDTLEEIESVGDLVALGPFAREDLCRRPLADFVPRALLQTRGTELVLGETGGTLGQPVRSVFTPEEFEQGFGAPFLAASRVRGFPRGGRWLYAGPSGPHIIGQAARLLARCHGCLEPFCVDLDPRWARSQSGVGARLYAEHVLCQVLDLFAREHPDVLFLTPPLLVALSEELSTTERASVRGIHLGGLPLEPGQRARFQEAFPQAVILPGYGNSLLGLLSEVAAPTGDELDYFALEGRLVVEVCAEDAEGVRLGEAVAPGERGRVVAHRLDRSFFLPNLVERDSATRVEAPAHVQALGFAACGVRDPGPAPALAPVAHPGSLY